MTRYCEKCGKTSQMETKRKLLRGHYNPVNRIRKYPNLQWTRDKDGRRVRVCTQCLRTNAKVAKS